MQTIATITQSPILKKHPKAFYWCYERHLIAGETPVTVQLGAQDAEDHHLHGISHLTQRNTWDTRRTERMTERHFQGLLWIPTHASPVTNEIFHWKTPNPITSSASSTENVSVEGQGQKQWLVSIYQALCFHLSFSFHFTIKCHIKSQEKLTDVCGCSLTKCRFLIFNYFNKSLWFAFKTCHPQRPK